MTGFDFPPFFNYPPYFTLQPIQETREKQLKLWRDLMLAYCSHNKIYVVNVDEQFPLFQNKEINRKLDKQFIVSMMDDLVRQGNGEWINQQKSSFLVLWKNLHQWAEILYTWVRSSGQEDAVMTLDELSNGDDVKGSELEGVHTKLIMRAIQVLEGQGKAQLFKGAAGDDEGVRFYTS
eukprot:TRINITY_DN14318_c0_g3_i1.p2 TRINITY_DN14318_c0_g3~~TRINITY_DN14318_c0_g3_i1.p2  ORF type:complete len:178 (+),score=15.44 TRINITY_DN14318_c0_g3_i1:62-595(+)